MLCVLAGRGRYAGGVYREPGPDGGPPAEIELESPRRFARTDPRLGDVYEVHVAVWRRAGTTRDGEPQYVHDRTYLAERTD
ncbi:hypothetical protein [Actinomycetospora flava]|uniref:Uncharacterized protein n=1 Tax=Actinomycetospora flava TaxID=3129232 RepID=A0ABU8MDS4_9PSEU